MIQTTVSHKAAALTAASALAMYDAAECAADKARAAAAMADVLRAQLAKAPAKKASKGPSDLLTAENLLATLKRMPVNQKATIPILSHVLLQAEGGRLKITGTDLESCYVEILRAPDLGDFEVTAEAGALMKALRGCKGDVGMTFNEDGRLVFTAGGMVANLTSLEIGDFPLMNLPEGEPSARSTMASSKLVEPLAFVLPSISVEETRYYLNGAYMHVIVDQGQPRLTIVATDGSRLLLDRGEDNAGLRPDMPGVIIPKAAVGWIVGNVRDDELEIEVWETQIRVTTATGCYQTKLIDGNYPDYARVVPRDDDGKVVIGIHEPKAWIEALGRLGAHTQSKYPSARLTVTADKIVGTSRSMVNMEDASIELPAASIQGAPVELAFNTKMMAEVLKQGDIAVMGFHGPNDPALVTWPASPGRRGVIMPLRV